MKTRLSILVSILTLTFLSCKNEPSISFNYSYSDKPAVIDCNHKDSLLLKEAYYTFENDIVNEFDPTGQNVRRAYPTFMRNVSSGRMDFSKLASEHAIEIFNALQTSDLWKDGNLDYQNELFDCIGENITDEALKTTYASLIESGFMTNKLFGPPLATKSNFVANDKYLSTFVALDFYIANLAGVTPEPEMPDNSPVDFNKVPSKLQQ